MNNEEENPVTFDEFVATKRFVTDLAEDFGDPELKGSGYAYRAYDRNWGIVDMNKDKGFYWTLAENMDYTSKNLEDCERWLFARVSA